MEFLDMEKLEKVLPKGKKGKMIFLAAAGGVGILALYLSGKKQENALYTPEAYGGYPEAGAATPGDVSEDQVYTNMDAIYAMFDGLYTRQEAQMEAQADYMEKVVTKVQNSAYKVDDIEDMVSPLMQQRNQQQDDYTRMAQNSDAWFTASPAERTKLEQENASIAAKYGLTRNPTTGSWIDQTGKVAYVTTKQVTEASTATVAKSTQNSSSGGDSKTVSITSVDAQMKANSEAWHKASTQAEKDRLHAENVKLGSLASKTYNSKTGVWA